MTFWFTSTANITVVAAAIGNAIFDATGARLREVPFTRERTRAALSAAGQGEGKRDDDDRHRHTMNIRRGPDGDGIAAMKCNTCHQDHNLEGRHMPPGAPDWHLPPAGMPMIWAGLDDRQLCELFNDPRQNGGRDVDGIVEHMSTPLVLWGWNPGEGRTPVPVPQAEFMAKVKEWASKGAACPGGPTPSHATGASH